MGCPGGRATPSVWGPLGWMITTAYVHGTYYMYIWMDQGSKFVLYVPEQGAEIMYCNEIIDKQVGHLWLS